MDRDPTSAGLRIGELSRRVGVSEHVLRAWESRYRLLTPARSDGGYRLYSADDERRVRRMQAYLARGLAAAQAAQAVLAGEQPGASDDAEEPALADLAGATDALRQALDGLDEQGAQSVLDRLLSAYTVQTVLRDVLLPYLHELGERWESGIVTVGQEHFASNVIRGRLSNLARGWGNGAGPQALLACPPGELHDLSLLAFGIVLNRAGWRISYLGADTPIDDLIAVTTSTRPSLVVLAATTPDRFATVERELSQLAALAPLAVAGAGATERLAARIDARLLAADAVTAAERVATRT
ncbi:MAG: B12-binding domain-containing protein [Mycobacteriales bacterium]